MLGGAAVASLGTVFLFFVIALVSCSSLSRKSRMVLWILWCAPWAILYLVWRSPSSPKVMSLEAIFVSYLVPILILIVTAFVILRVCSRQQQRLAAQREVRILLLAAFVTLFLVVGLILPQAFPSYEGRVDDLSFTETIRGIRKSPAFSWAEMTSGPLQLLGLLIDFDSEKHVRWISFAFRSIRSERRVVFYSRGGGRLVFKIGRRPKNLWEPLFEEDELESSLRALDKKGLSGLVQEILQLCPEAHVEGSPHLIWRLYVGPASDSKDLEMVIRANRESGTAGRTSISTVLEAHYHPENVTMRSISLAEDCSGQ